MSGETGVTRERPMRVRPILDALIEQLTAQLKATGVIEHPGESGRAREQIVTSFLTSIVPEDFAVTSGFIIDADGQISRQIDLVIYRRGYHPVFRIGAIPLVLIEAVAAAIEVKAAIDSEADLLTALENLESVRRLDRSNHGENYTLVGGQRGEAISDTHVHRVFTAALTEKSLTMDALAEKLLVYLRTHPRRWWPNAYVDIYGSHVAFAEMSGEGMRTNWDYDGARLMTITDPSDKTNVASLVEFSASLLDFLRITPLIDYKSSSYLALAGGRIRWWRLDDQEMPPFPQAIVTTS